jgi:NCS1 family nucleobase:cation symporter-1
LQLFLQNLFIQAANMATFATNNADIARYARRPNDALWTQFFGMPIAFGVIAFFGVFVTSASKVIFGTVYWDPMAILDGFLLNDYNSSTRAGVFFIALGFSFAQVTSMIFANLIAAGNDTSAMWPRYINYRRGAIICLVIAFAITPWNLTKTSFAFTSYLGR